MAGEPISTNPKSLSHLRVVIDRLRRLDESTASTVAAGTGATSEQTASGTVTAGAPVYSVGSGTVAHADATTFATAHVIGVATVGGLTTETVTIAHAGTAVVTGWGLTAGSRYFLNTTAGTMTTTPLTTVGESNVLIGVALSTTEMALLIREPILL